MDVHDKNLPRQAGASISVRQAGDNLEIVCGGRMRLLPLAVLDDLAYQIGCSADAIVMAWHCISGVEALFSAIEKYGFVVTLSEADIHEKDTKDT